MIRASDLAPGVIAIDGMGANPGHTLSSVPVRLLANVPGAVEMRIGNTADALALSDWQSYSAESRWYVPTGNAERTVYVEFRMADGGTVTLTIDVPPYDPSLASNYGDLIPISTALQHDGLGGPVWSQEFASAGHDGWAATPDSLDTALPGFQPASWSGSGGATDRGGHIWIDSSRWASQELAGNDVVIALYNKVGWISRTGPTLDVSGLEASFRTETGTIDLKGGQGYFFIQDSSGALAQRGPAEHR